MYKIAISDERTNVIDIIDDITLDRDEADELEAEYWLGAEDRQLALGARVGRAIKDFEKESGLTRYDTSKDFYYYRRNLCFYLASLALGLFVLCEISPPPPSLLSGLGLLALFSFVGGLVSAVAVYCTDIVASWFRRGNHSKPPPLGVSTLSTIIMLCLTYFVLKIVHHLYSL